MVLPAIAPKFDVIGGVKVVFWEGRLHATTLELHAMKGSNSTCG
jgi:hypothetical protein